MGKQYLLLAVAVFAGVAAGCSSRRTAACRIVGHTSFPEYDMAYLADLDRQRMDSVALTDGSFRFEVSDSVGSPYALVVQLVDREDPLNQMEMPVMVEGGDIRLELGEYIHTSGSPLNDGVQHFLNALQACKDRVVADKTMSVPQINAAFSEFYRQQILANRGNALGRYIFHDYGNHLLPADREETEKQLTNN